MLIKLITVILMVVAACTLCSQSQPADITLEGEVVYSGLDALPWHSQIYIHVTDETTAKTVAKQNIVTEGEQIPITFSVDIPSREFFRNHNYSVCAEIRIFERLAFTCGKPVVFHGTKRPKQVRLELQRVK